MLTPVNAMFIVVNKWSISQAGRRRFDPGLPLHKINSLQTINRFAVTAITAFFPLPASASQPLSVRCAPQAVLEDPRFAIGFRRASVFRGFLVVASAIADDSFKFADCGQLVCQPRSRVQQSTIVRMGKAVAIGV